jgi:4'-phosphopantetheinyl transferase
MSTNNPIRVVHADLNSLSGFLFQSEHLLTPSDQIHINPWPHNQTRQRWIQRRILLRLLLAQFLDTDPGSIPIAYASTGKPYIDQEYPAGKIYFSQSSSQNRVVYAFGTDTEVGIDIEYMDPHIDCLGIAERFFAPSEAQKLRSLGNPELIKAFYDCWSCKEAYIKVSGLTDPAAFAVSFRPDPPGLLMAPSSQRGPSNWMFHRINLGSEWSVILVAEGKDREIIVDAANPDTLS